MTLSTILIALAFLKNVENTNRGVLFSLKLVLSFFSKNNATSNVFSRFPVFPNVPKSHHITLKSITLTKI